MRGLTPRLAMNLLLALALPAAAQGAATSSPSASQPPRALAFALSDTAAVDSLLLRADRCLRAGAPDSVLWLVDPLAARAVAEGDSRNELRARLHQAGALALTGRLREAEAMARRASDLARQMDAPAAGRMARRWLGYALLGQGRGAEAADTYKLLRQDARAAKDHREEGYALMGLAYQALGRGEAAAARVDYQRAAGLLAAAGEVTIALDAQVGLARALGAEGRHQDMRRIYERILREGESGGHARIVGYALNNLGSYEYQAGDPGRAVEYWERALATKRAGGDPLALITPTVNLALARMSLGAFDEARATLVEMLDRCRAGGYREQEAQVLGQLATFEQAHGRQAEALTLWRQALDMQLAVGQDGLESAVEIVISLAKAGRAEEAIDFADSVVVTLPGKVDTYESARLELACASARAAAGRHAEALAPASRARARFKAGGFRTDELAALVALGNSERALSRTEPARVDSALTRLEEARRLWEEVRSVPRDPQWRERRGALATAIHMDLAFLLLDHAAVDGGDGRVRRAFDTLQGYKARTLLERRLGPDAFPAGAAAATVEPVISLEDLQRRVLRSGEVLLDYYLGERASLVFVVTDTSCRTLYLPAAQALRGLSGLFLDLVASPSPADGSQVPDPMPAARRLAQEMLTPVGKELATAERVLIAADGFLTRLPFELLPLPGRDGALLGSACEVARVPSASVLARLRLEKATTSTGEVRAYRGLVLLSGDGASATPELPGALREARHLTDNYRDVRELAPAGPVVDGQWLRAAAGAAVLHIPAHSEAFDQRPWNSRIRVGTGGDGQPWWLLSADIAAAPLDVSLSVLSGCSSAGGQALSGEGMLGLTGAFLAAGSRAVVASLWDVDDGATSLLMERFYRELAAGRTVAGALAAARRALAGNPATAAPHYWAGFVVVGDGALKVPLERRSPAGQLAVYGAGAAATAGAAWLALGGRSRRIGRARVISGAGGSLP